MKISPKNKPSSPSSADFIKADSQFASPLLFLSSSLIRPLILVSLSIAIPVSTSLALKSQTSEKNHIKTLSTSQEKPQNFTFFSLLPEDKKTLKTQSSQPNNLEKNSPNLPQSQPINHKKSQAQDPQKTLTKTQPKIFNTFVPAKTLAETNNTQNNSINSPEIPNPIKQNPKKITQNNPENPSSTISTPSIP